MKALRNDRFRRWFLPCVVSYIGTWMQIMSQSWLIFEITKSTVWLGVMGFVSGLPILLFGKKGGLYVDKCNQYKNLVFTQSTQAVISLICFIYISFGNINPAVIITAAFFTNLIGVIDSPLRNLVVFKVNGSEPSGFGMMSVAWNLSRIIGPAIAAMVIFHFGVKWCFFFNFLSFFWLLKSIPVSEHRKVSSVGSFDSRLLLFRPFYVLINIFAWPLMTLLPFFSASDPRLLGDFMGVFGFGAIVFSVGVSSYLKSGNEFRASLFLLFLIVVSGLIFALFPSLRILSLFVYGGGLIGFSVIIPFFVHRLVNHSARGTLSAIYSSTAGFAIFGNLSAGILSNYVDPGHTVIFFMLLLLVIGCCFILKTRKTFLSLK